MVFLLALALAGCEQLTQLRAQVEEVASDVDEDGDGWTPSQGDCNQSCETKLLDPSFEAVCEGWYWHPMSPENLELLSVGIELDQDCDGTVDSEQPGLDFDGDGFDGVPTPGSVRDCDDRNRMVRPGAPDACEDGIDQNCDGEDSVCEVE